MSHLPSSEYIRNPGKAAQAFARATLEHQANKKREAHNAYKAGRRRKARANRRRAIAHASRKAQWQ
jgi:hypothetical protein